MYATDLIRHDAAAEILATGSWQLPTNHVSFLAEARPRARSRNRRRAPVVRGVLEVADDPRRTSLALSIRPADGDAVLGRLLRDTDGPLVLHVAGLAPDERGDWSGRAHIESATQCWPASLDVDYRGVYVSGERALAWFVLRCEIVTEAARGLRRRRSIAVRVDLLAIAPELDAVAIAA